MAKQKFTRAEKSWIMYDVGNSALVLLATSVIPIYFSSLAPEGGVVVAWSYAETIASLIIALLIDAVAYACYLFFLSKAEENMGKLWFAFILAYVLASSDKLAIVWQMLAANAGTH